MSSKHKGESNQCIHEQRLVWLALNLRADFLTALLSFFFALPAPAFYECCSNHSKNHMTAASQSKQSYNIPIKKKKELEPTETSLSLKQKNKLGRRWHNDLLVLQQCNYKHDEGLVNLNDQLQYFIWSRHRVAGEIEGNVWSFSPDFYSKCDAVPAGNVGNVLICVFQEKELQNLAAMDMELQKIAAKLHENTA